MLVRNESSTSVLSERLKNRNKEKHVNEFYITSRNHSPFKSWGSILTSLQPIGFRFLSGWPEAIFFFIYIYFFYNLMISYYESNLGFIECHARSAVTKILPGYHLLSFIHVVSRLTHRFYRNR